ncbi:hypothetical protein NMH_1196 [Neisseria meningitidis H44/76]|uniref:Uncharacterized protein n=6 Tax=Neisseria meningitidis TaxID=487 RepID=E6MXV8_NEIMH|nr:hypothetical protein [Neisseria meningitidis]EFM04836.1 hypothetical protein HMPREF0602_0667 [Neisseria meningitidis ATCC 13091]EFV63514.1 hypothetical protein NMH_1196 [Neisseria meningitidis H44/76]CBA04507.1 hypothetical protein predicted by Glimmer/Critica [Neisseria meningitidis alpha153]CBA07358.1 hypothetical protein predicted by Glimmer/Critica [Neisseria meningitidis alpha275]CCA44360.1 hypothetical protein NMALPHA522_0819 [Neisseria meningitidis alpha522]
MLIHYICLRQDENGAGCFGKPMPSEGLSDGIFCAVLFNAPAVRCV